MALEAHDEPRTADWWLLRLGRKLTDRQEQLEVWWRYYTGDHPLPRGPRKATEAFKDFQKKARSNFCGEVVNASVDRLKVVGVVNEEGLPDDQAMQWWNRNRMQARQSQLWRATLALSEAYVMVGRRAGTDDQPLATLEHPREVYVEYTPDTGERRAAIKAWYDDVERVACANVFLDGVLVKYQTDRRGPGPLRWGPMTWTMIDVVEHDLGVPVVPFACRPFLGESPQPEFGEIVDIQDRVNLGVLNRMTAERYTAFRQKWVKGHKFRTTTDPMTGLPVVEQPFVPDPGGVWASSGEKTEFGEFGQTQLGDYLRGHEMDIRDLLVISRTPAYTYAGDLVNIATDTLQALDTAHVSKVEEHQATFDEGLQDVLDLMARAARVDVDYTQAHIRWRNPRHLNPAVAADAATKKKSLGYPLGVLAEDLGEPPPRIRRILADNAADTLMGARALQLAQQAGGIAADAIGSGGQAGADGGA